MTAAILLMVTLGASPALERARAQADDFDAAGALKTLDAALAEPGNDRETMLGIFELQGIVWGNLNKGTKARAAFVLLLSLDPQRALSGDHPPRVRTPFYEAKEAVERAGALALERQPPGLLGDQVVQLNVTVTHDSQKLVRSVRFHARIGDHERTAVVSTDAKGRAALPAVGTVVRWWAEALGDREAVLVLLGSADGPLEESAAAPVPPPPPVPLVEAPAPLPAATRGWMRPAGVVLALAGAASLGVGGYFGLASRDAYGQLARPTRDGQGRVTNFTEVQAAALDQQARASAQIANALFVAGGVVAALGGGFLVFGGPSGGVSVSAAGPGAVVSATF